MKTVVAAAPGRIEIHDTPIPRPGPYQALVRTECACVCNQTDGELLGGRFPGMEQAFPFALGHETVGVVMDTGARVRNFQKGDQVVERTPLSPAPRFCIPHSPSQIPLTHNP